MGIVRNYTAVQSVLGPRRSIQVRDPRTTRLVPGPIREFQYLDQPVLVRGSLIKVTGPIESHESMIFLYKLYSIIHGVKLHGMYRDAVKGSLPLSYPVGTL